MFNPQKFLRLIKNFHIYIKIDDKKALKHIGNNS